MCICGARVLSDTIRTLASLDFCICLLTALGTPSKYAKHYLPLDQRPMRQLEFAKHLQYDLHDYSFYCFCYGNLFFEDLMRVIVMGLERAMSTHMEQLQPCLAPFVYVC